MCLHENLRKDVNIDFIHNHLDLHWCRNKLCALENRTVLTSERGRLPLEGLTHLQDTLQRQERGDNDQTGGFWVAGVGREGSEMSGVQESSAWGSDGARQSPSPDRKWILMPTLSGKAPSGQRRGQPGWELCTLQGERVMGTWYLPQNFAVNRKPSPPK